jgi:metal-responsive CopG/Arc/MetJ family transcriptional regulator
MKPIQVLIDEPLLRRLDADAEVKEVGRSEVMRRAVAAYLRRSGARRISEAYRKAYGQSGGLGDEWAGWEDEGVWPAK